MRIGYKREPSDQQSFLLSTLSTVSTRAIVHRLVHKSYTKRPKFRDEYIGYDTQAYRLVKGTCTGRLWRVRSEELPPCVILYHPSLSDSLSFLDASSER